MADKNVKDAEVIEEKNTSNEKVEKVKDYKTRRIIRTAWDIFFWLCFLCILAMWIIDYVNTINEQDPTFCLANKTIEVESGSVEQCTGVGYKVFVYHTDDMEGAREFGAFWIQPRR